MDLQLLDSIIECSVCLERLKHDARVLPCQHTFCLDCLRVNINRKCRKSESLTFFLLFFPLFRAASGQQKSAISHRLPRMPTTDKYLRYKLASEERLSHKASGSDQADIERFARRSRWNIHTHRNDNNNKNESIKWSGKETISPIKIARWIAKYSICKSPLRLPYESARGRRLP